MVTRFKKIATFKQISAMLVICISHLTNVGHPTLRAWKYPLPGDKDIPMISRCVINIEDAKVGMFNIPPDPHRASLSDDISSSGTFDDIGWNPDGTNLLFFLLPVT
jgi:hypothetical protein